MVALVSAEKALLRRYNPRANNNFRTQFIGTDRHQAQGEPDRTALAPVAYLIEQAPHSELRAHFHVANQFQIFVSGEGKIGGHRAASGIGHFAGPYTAYGPIVGGDTGVGYMTLRNAWDDGAQFLPEEIERLRPHRQERREVLMTQAAPASDAELAALTEASCTSLMNAEADGLGAWSLKAPPHGVVTGPAPSSGGGQFWLVMSGGMVDRGEGPMGRLSLAFVPPDEAPFVARAGAAGLHVLVMQFPVMGRH